MKVSRKILDLKPDVRMHHLFKYTHPRNPLEVINYGRTQLRKPFHGEAALGVDVQRFALHAAELLRDLNVHRQLHPELRLAHSGRSTNLPMAFSC